MDRIAPHFNVKYFDTMGREISEEELKELNIHSKTVDRILNKTQDMLNQQNRLQEASK